MIAILVVFGLGVVLAKTLILGVEIVLVLSILNRLELYIEFLFNFLDIGFVLELHQNVKNVKTYVLVIFTVFWQN